MMRPARQVGTMPGTTPVEIHLQLRFRVWYKCVQPNCRQRGVWPEMVSGWDPHEEPERYTPFMPVKNVSASYPPTLLIHGTVDTDVPYEQSLMMSEEFHKHSVPHKLISIPGGEHGLAGGDSDQINAAYDAAGEFVNRYMKGNSSGP
ncbi:MAG: alpha/beta hydrolase family protein [Pirellulaceae bacterium]